MSRNRRSEKQEQHQAGMAGRVGGLARDNPVAAGGSVVMALTGCLIVANALGLQTGRHPAPLFMTRDWVAQEPEGRVAVQAPKPSSLVLDLQSALRRLGLYNGPLDGLNGPATNQAIRAYERGLGRPETGEASEALLAVITLQGNVEATANLPIPRPKPGTAAVTARAAPEQVSAPNPAKTDVPSDPILAQVQQILSDLGYGPLQADGVMGGNTSSAIQRFELDRGLPITGEPSEGVISRLEMVSGQKVRR